MGYAFKNHILCLATNDQDQEDFQYSMMLGPICLLFALYYNIQYFDEDLHTAFLLFAIEKPLASSKDCFWKNLLSFMTLGPGSKCVPACSLSFTDMPMWTSVQSLMLVCAISPHLMHLMIIS